MQESILCLYLIASPVNFAGEGGGRIGAFLNCSFHLTTDDDDDDDDDDGADD